MRAWDARAELSGIALPTLVVVGEDEAPALREQAELLAGEIPGARQLVIPKAGHMLPLEQPDALSEAVCEFLEGQ